MGNLADEALHDQSVEQANGVFDCNTEQLGEHGRRQQRGGRQQVDRGSGMRIATPSGDGVAGVPPAAFDQTQQGQTVRGLGGDRVEEMPDPEVARPWNRGGKRGGPVSSGQGRAVTPRSTQYRARAARIGGRSPP